MVGGPLFGVPNSAGIVLADGYVLPPPPSVGLPGSGVWRDQKKLVMSKDATLPQWCIKCNAPTNGLVLKRKLTWHHPAIYLILLVAALIYVIVAMVVRKRATVEIGLCEKHLAKRRQGLWITYLLFFLGVGGFVLAIAAEDVTYLLVGVVLLLASVIFALAAVRIVLPTKIDDRFVWLKGVNEDYLDRLPQWPGVPA
jgi:hypothetical protein